MASESILENPALFSDTLVDLDLLAHEYLDCVEEYPGEAGFFHIKDHLSKILY